MKVVVTGGAGFIGSHIVESLIEAGIQPIIIDNLVTGKNRKFSRNVTSYQVNLTDKEELDRIFKSEKPDFVIHQAAQVDVQTSISNPILDAQTNILGTISLLECCREYQIKKIIYASSCAIYGDKGDKSINEQDPASPLSFYGLSKLTPENYIKLYQQMYKLPYTILRYSNVYGPRQSIKSEGGVVAIFINQLLNGKQPKTFGDGTQTRDFVFVKDVANANILSLFHGENQTLNIGCNKQTSIGELYAMISSLLKSSITPNHLPARKGDIVNSHLDNQLAASILGWQPLYGLDEGIKETIIYYKSKM